MRGFRQPLTDGFQKPVVVMINKAIIEMPPRFAGHPPIAPPGAPASRRPSDAWPGATGVAEDMRRHGHWMREEAEKRIGRWYPRMKITGAMIEGRGALAGETPALPGPISSP